MAEIAIRAQLPALVESIEVTPGESVSKGAVLVVLEAMKMQHVVEAPAAGVVRRLAIAEGDTVADGELLLTFEESAEVEWTPTVSTPSVVLEGPRADLAEVLDRHALTHDAARPEAVGRRHAAGRRTARENVADLCDPGTFVEYGSLVIAAQRRRRSVEDLISRTPADGLVAGFGEIDGHPAAVLSYDYMVLAGTQGAMNHAKKDRIFDLALRRRTPVVLFAEGGGGRPGDTDTTMVSGLDTMAFHLFARLNGQVPLVGIAAGRCFAGNAALLGCCDVIIATPDANIGMGGPAMIEGGGLGVFAPEEIGPASVQTRNGVIDLLAGDEAEAVSLARRYLSYFSGPGDSWTCADPVRLRDLIPQDRKRVYEIRKVIETLADTDSVLELRRDFGVGIVTSLVRIEGRPLGLIANNPAHLGGAVDTEAADKAARFLQMCSAHGLPVVSLCDTPGFMVGPAAEETATVRHFSRLFIAGAHLRVPICVVILRKGYGLGAQAMAGGSFHVPLFTVAWPTGEIGGMGLEGAVRLGFRKELAAAEDPDALFEELVEAAYEQGKALNAATVFELDDVIDPATTRQWITTALRDLPPASPTSPSIDTW